VLSVAEDDGGKRQPVTLVNADFLPRAFLVGQARLFETYDDILAYMKTDEFDPAGEVLLMGSEDEGVDSPGQEGPGTVEIIEYGARGMTLKAEAISSCYLVVSDVYYPGWRVYVDGNEDNLLRADYAFRAVRIDPGVHVVKMEYTPLFFKIGVLFSLAGIGLLTVLVSSRRGAVSVRGG
jgi:hypothetical protein